MIGSLVEPVVDQYHEADDAYKHQVDCIHKFNLLRVHQYLWHKEVRHEIDHWYDVKYQSLEEYHLDCKLELAWHELHGFLILKYGISYFIHWSIDLIIDAIFCYRNAHSVSLDEEKVLAEVDGEATSEGHPEDVYVTVGPRFAVDLKNFHVVPVWGAYAIAKALHSLIILEIYIFH